MTLLLIVILLPAVNVSCLLVRSFWVARTDVSAEIVVPVMSMPVPAEYVVLVADIVSPEIVMLLPAVSAFCLPDRSCCVANTVVSAANSVPFKVNPLPAV